MPLLDVQNINLSFGGLKVIKDLSFSVDQGSIVSLIGPNGAGKTSVFNCLTGFYRPDTFTAPTAATLFSTAVRCGAKNPTKSPSAAWRAPFKTCVCSKT
jgi:ABC-type branched-subunit amino acid transport system ATPase component